MVGQLHSLIVDTAALIDPYGQLLEDPTQDGIEFSGAGANLSPEYFETATVNQVRRYLVLLTRGERFCDGYIASQFDEGVLLAAFRRLRGPSRGDGHGGERSRITGAEADRRDP